MELSNERLGLLGGSFNPVHIAHLLLAQEAWYRYKLGRVAFIPTAQNPLKSSPELSATGEQRLAMVKLACKDDSRFSVDATEVRHGGTSYTIDTLKRYFKLHRKAELYLIVGADAATALDQWKDISAYSSYCTVVISNRPGEADFSQGLQPHLQDLGLKYEYMPLPTLDVSSSGIRRRIAQGKPIRYLVPDGVADFIHTRELYR